MDNELENAIVRTRDALEATGLHTWEIAEGIVNVYTEPVTDEPDPARTDYLFTVTVTVTP